MAVNGRCYLFFEIALVQGKLCHNLAAHITDCILTLSLDIDFAISLYEDLLACRKLTNLRTLCHKFPGHLSDPIIRGFRHKHKGNVLHTQIRLADEVFNSTKFRQLAAISASTTSTDMVPLISALHQLFTEFQPVADRTQLGGRCRKRSWYDVPRLVAAAQHFGADWGFSPEEIICKYNAMPYTPSRRFPRPLPTLPLKDFSFSAASSSKLNASSFTVISATSATPPRTRGEASDTAVDDPAWLVFEVADLTSFDRIPVLTSHDNLEIQSSHHLSPRHCFDLTGEPVPACDLGEPEMPPTPMWGQSACFDDNDDKDNNNNKINDLEAQRRMLALEFDDLSRSRTDSDLLSWFSE